MAIYNGPFKIKGRLAGFTFYDRDDKTIVRKLSGKSGATKNNSKTYESRDKNNAEFRLAQQAGKALRLLFREQFGPQFLNTCCDAYLHSRLNGVFNKILGLDISQPRGQRTVTNGMLMPEAATLLRSLSFHKDRHFYDHLSVNSYMDANTSTLHLSSIAFRKHIHKDASIQLTAILLVWDSATASFSFHPTGPNGNLSLTCKHSDTELSIPYPILPPGQLAFPLLYSTVWLFNEPTLHSKTYGPVLGWV